MDDAKGIFEGCIRPDVVSWGACIAGYAAEGSFMASLRMFSSIELEGIRPNEVSFASVLSACSHSGLVSEALGYFDSMLGEYAISRSMKHYINLVDLFGRAGDFGKLENMLANMPMQADITVWLCVLGMCLRHGQLQLAERAFDNAVDLRPLESTAYVLMSNIYAIVEQGDPLAAEF
jgi:pentatricopeptide repeat protein